MLEKEGDMLVFLCVYPYVCVEEDFEKINK